LKGQIWSEFLVLVSIFILAFVSIFSSPFTEAHRFSKTAIGYVVAQKVAAIEEINAPRDMYIAHYYTSSDGEEVNVEGEYNKEELNRALWDILAPLGVGRVFT